jgi:hypothetical protein
MKRLIRLADRAAGLLNSRLIANRALRNMQASLRLISLIIFTASAAAAAIGLGYLARDGLELSRHVVRTDALITAASIGGVMMLLRYSDRFGKK